MAAQNKSLGKFVLDGIPPAPRGVPQVEVTFDIDANGILKVTAKDKATGRSQHITITASSGLSDTEIEQMRREAESHAEEDRLRKENIEFIYKAYNEIYTAEKALRDFGEKIPAEVKTNVEEKVAATRKALDLNDTASIKTATEELGQVIQSIGAAAYGAADGVPGAAPGDDGNAPPPGDSPDEDVIEGEFRES